MHQNNSLQLNTPLIYSEHLKEARM